MKHQPLAVVGIILGAFLSVTLASTSVESFGSGFEASSCSTFHPASDFFEGVEKRIEIFFEVAESDEHGLRSLSRDAWNTICDKAKCEIIHEEVVGRFDSYILSESSLFVYRDRLMMKTCGTTLPLSSVDEIVAQAKQVVSITGPLRMVYSRSSFLSSTQQSSPHHDFDVEIEYLNTLAVDGQVIEGETVVHGDIDAKYWLVHTKEFKYSNQPNLIMAECMMTGLSAPSRASFYQNPLLDMEANEAAMAATFKDVLPYSIEGKCFTPCGYSCNARGTSHADLDSYFTVHVTPQEAFSYSSVEAVFTNEENVMNKISDFVINTISVFTPMEVSVNIIAHQGLHIVLPPRLRLDSGESYTLQHEDCSTKTSRIVYSLDYRVVSV